MTDSTIDGGSGDGTSELGPSMDELFGGIESLPESEPVDRNEPAETGDEDEPVEDVTAADVFEQLQTEVEVSPADSDALLEDETPDEIIESADEPAEPEGTVDDDILADEDELDSLLLPGRTKADEFLWVETPDTESEDSAGAASDPAGTTAQSARPDEPTAVSEDGTVASDAGSEGDDAEPERTEDAASPSIPEEEIEAFTKEGPDAASTSASPADDSSDSPTTSNASGNDAGGSTKTRSDRRGKARKRSRRNRSKSEKAGGFYAKLRSKLSEMV